jgi:hypothetical protein
LTTSANSLNIEPESAYPPPPKGYAAPVRFRYPIVGLQVASLVILLVFGLIFGRIATSAQGISFGQWFSLNIVEIVIILATLLLTIVVHELIHGLVFRLLGYDVKYGIAPALGAAYAAAFGQWQKRSHNAVAAAAPLILLTVIGVPLLTIPDVISNIAFVLLLINTSGAVGDAYILYRLARMPRNTLLYDISIETMLIYYPLQAPEQNFQKGTP